MKNNDIRQMIRVLRLHHYEVAERIGISETTFCVWLRSELTEERRSRVMKAIEELRCSDGAS